jgi:membrane protease YdiL (CAAX protease family)
VTAALVVLSPLPLMLVANAAVGRSWAAQAAAVLPGLLAGAVILFGIVNLASASHGGTMPLPAAGGLMVAGAVAGAAGSRLVRERVARAIPIDPNSPVHALALAVAVVVLGWQMVSIAFTNVLTTDQALPPLTIWDVLSQELPFLVLAAVGVGLIQRRALRETATRLGLVRPSGWQLSLALACAGAFYAFALLMGALSEAWTPQVANQVGATTQHLFGGLNGPVGIATVALAPGLCEEILFRGAVQPRLGVIATALLFTSIHTQYGLSLDALAVFCIAIGLGLIRRYANTTTSSTCHVAYNLLVGIGIAGGLVGAVAILVEAGLIAFTAYAIWSGRQRVASAGT